MCLALGASVCPPPGAGILTQGSPRGPGRVLLSPSADSRKCVPLELSGCLPPLLLPLPSRGGPPLRNLGATEEQPDPPAAACGARHRPLTVLTLHLLWGVTTAAAAAASSGATPSGATATVTAAAAAAAPLLPPRFLCVCSPHEVPPARRHRWMDLSGVPVAVWLVGNGGGGTKRMTHAAMKLMSLRDSFS